MDPVTHGAVGIAAALSIVASKQPRASTKTKWAAALCGLAAGELPDADRVFDACFHWYGPAGGGLAYMLYHRGPLHTVVFCVIASLGLAWLTQRFARRLEPPPSSLLFVIATAGSLLHLAMDATNDYGVHPLYPYQRWFYGDFLFLAEPTVSAALLPYIFVMLGKDEPKLVRRRVAMAFAAGLLFMACEHDWIQPFGVVLTSLWLVPQALLQLKGPRPRIAWASLLLVLLCFFACSRIARARGVQWATQMAAGGASTFDIVTTPAPGNPFCWRVITVSRAQDAFDVRLGITSLWSPFVRDTDCFSPPNGPAPHAACGIALPKPTEVAVDGATILELAAFSGRVSTFEQMARDNPRVSATRHFLRAPFWGEDARKGASQCTPSQLLIGDLRVDYNPEDVEHFSKYSFAPKKSEPYEQRMPVGDAPFFR